MHACLEARMLDPSRTMHDNLCYLFLQKVGNVNDRETSLAYAVLTTRFPITFDSCVSVGELDIFVTH